MNDNNPPSLAYTTLQRLECESIITSESPNIFRIRKIREIDTLLESLNLTASPLKKDPSCLKGDVGFVKLFKTYEIGDVSEEELEEEEVVEVDELGVEYFDKFPTRDEEYKDSQMEVDEVANQMPHKIDQFRSIANMEKEYKQSV
ncbi:hypothetical protein Tco_0780822 [Tanacetum coccineum]